MSLFSAGNLSCVITHSGRYIEHYTTSCLLAGACWGAGGPPQEAEGVSGAEPAHCVHAPGSV
jgi:hypothetical protein